MSEPLLPARYETGPRVGRGAMGSVWRARDRVLDVPVAVKIPHPAFADSTRGRAFFEREVRAAASVVHPHLVPLHDWGHLADGTPFLAMAWADGGSLETPPRAWADLRDRVAEVLSALAALHARGLVHRDLKPANVLIHRGRAWVADLGLAATTEDLGRGPARIEGTPKYMAPEQREGRVREIGPATDLYAVGAILDELSGGMAVPEDLEDLLHALLHPDPLGRYDLAADAIRALSDLGEAVVERPPGARITTTTSSAGPSSQRTFAFDAEATEEVLPDVLAGPPSWNRPAPPPWPEVPPPEPRDTTRLRASLPLFALREPPLVGRDALRARLWSAVGGVLRTGKPAVIVLCGEPGSGKTRIAESVARALEEGGHAEVVRVRDLPGGGPDHGFEGAARHLMRAWGEPRTTLEPRLARWLTRDRGPDAADLAPALCAWVGLREGDEPEADPGLGAQLVIDHLRARAWRGASALLVDDAHHDAGVTFDALSGLLIGAHLGDRLPLVALVTCDPQRLDADGRKALARLVAAGGQRVEVPRLDREATRELVEVLLPLVDDVAEWLTQRCEGHPSLARQILEHWAERGALVDAGQLVFTAAPGISLEAELPTDGADAYLARLDALGHPGEERTLAALAAAGDTMPEGVFYAVAGAMAAPLLASALVQRAEGWCRWEHGLVAAALRARLAERPDREALYGEVAAAWERFGGAPGRSADEQVGLLRLAAGRPAEALAPLLRACAASFQGVRHLEHDRCAEAALIAVERAGSAVPSLDRASARYHAAMGILRVGRSKDAVPLLIFARDAFLAAGDAQGAAEALLVLAAAYDLLGEHDAQLAGIDELESLARETRSSAIGCIALRARGRDRLNHGHYDEAEELFARLAVEEKAAGRELEALSALTDLAKARLRAWRMEPAADAARQALAIARRRGSLVHEGPAVHMLGQVAVYAADYEAAEPLLRRALHLAVLAHDETRVQLIVGDLADLAHARGDLERAKAGYLANLAYSHARGLRRWESVDRLRVGILALHMADGDEAIAQADALDEMLVTLEEPRLRPSAYALRLLGRSLRGDREGVGESLRAWDPEMGRLDLPFVRALEKAALTAVERGWTEEARAFAEHAAAQWMAHERPEDADRAWQIS